MQWPTALRREKLVRTGGGQIKRSCSPTANSRMREFEIDKVAAACPRLSRFYYAQALAVFDRALAQVNSRLFACCCAFARLYGLPVCDSKRTWAAGLPRGGSTLERWSDLGLDDQSRQCAVTELEPYARQIGTA